MIFVRVGQDQAKQLVLAFLDKGRVGHDYIDARQAFLAERNPHIDHQPLIVIAIKVQVHANFAGTSERHEQNVIFWQIQIHGSYILCFRRINYMRDNRSPCVTQVFIL